jgi:hypothetical protein
VVADDLTDLLRWCAALCEAPAELAAEVVLAAGHRWPELAESPEQLRELTVRTYLGSRRQFRPAIAPEPTGDLAAVQAAVAALPRTSRAVLVLFVLEHLTRVEIAAIVDRPPSVVAREYEHARILVGGDGYALAAALNMLTWQPVEVSEVHRIWRRRSAEVARHRRRRRVLAAVTTIATALLIAVPTVLARQQPDQVRAKGDWVFSSQLRPVTGWLVDARTITAEWEYTSLRPTNPNVTGGCWIAIGAKGAVWIGTLPRVRKTVLVRGRPASLGNTENNFASNALWWRYADDSLALIECPGVVDAEHLVVKIAGRLSFRTERMLIPFRIRELPTGYQVASVTQHTRPDSMVVQVARGDYPEGVLQFTISYRGPGQAGAPGKPIEVPAPTGVVSQRWASVCVPFGDSGICVEAKLPVDDDGDPYSHGLVRSLLQQTADQLQVSPSQRDRGRWYDARDAIPAP